ncbi:hypothetical protein K461DRAFT_324604 [Myriangium duriaei CBS 260.36]|uniref:Uncharacterized protein n=1 Tax=Myriangium duriaei CBS 260.36 TaxID=1168546 RepID=A0A9P4IR93_9PEZI|nr:hypothetical protein K461DRAFT_324604 [Myriangium duriaei CBS 260.36]
MPSNLRLQLDIQSTQSFYPRNTSPTPAPKSKMSLTQTYRVASTARGKLGMEAARADHNLRLLVGHANLLDSLMIELANAEREQEAWFNDTIRTANRGEAPKHIQWFDSIAEESEQTYDEDSDSDSDSESDIDADDFPVVTSSAPRRRSVSPPPTIVSTYELEDEDEEIEDYDSDSEELALQRVPSHTPELVHEDLSDSDDDSMPPSPSHTTISFDEKAQAHLQVTELFSKTEDLLTTNSAPMITAY